ncbi:MAG: hypothetical protein RJA48_486 [Verrucomicrobiota bacterium]|jgi:uncharacterized protein with von Willebrand factor type A (vWA) domain
MSTSLRTIDADSTNLLARLPVALIAASAACRVDGLRQTIEGAAAWRDALLKGVLPSAAGLWPTGPVGQVIWYSFPKSLLRFTKGNKDVADAVVENLLQIADGLRSDWENKAADDLAEWLRTESERRRQAAKEEEARRQPKEGQMVKPIEAKPITGKERETKYEEAKAALEGMLGGWAKARMEGAWGEKLAGWTSVSDVFGQLEGEASFGWDLSKGILKHVGWAKVEEMNKLLKALPQIAEIAKALGRAKASENELGPEERIMAKVSRVREELLWVEAPDARTHTDGIHKSDDIPRMLPMEGSLYLHPVFRKLWKAKFIERSLVCYQVKGIAQRRQISEEWVEEEQVVRKKLERGPIIVCLDTSGSMNGVPETVAKAITLEAMRLAHAEGRDCLLYAFSGSGDVSEHVLDLSPAGIESLCKFLCMSFHGGTDVSGPISAATRKLDGAKWKRADIIMVSDGEFGVPAHTQETLEEAKKKYGLRVHGLLVSNGFHGSYGMSSMRSLCDPVHVFRDWAEVKGL